MRQTLPLRAKFNIANVIQSASPGYIALSQWFLERHEPESYGETLKIDGVDTADEGHTEDEKFRIKLIEGIRTNIRARWRVKESNESNANDHKHNPSVPTELPLHSETRNATT